MSEENKNEVVEKHPKTKVEERIADLKKRLELQPAEDTFRISRKQWHEIATQLDMHHAVFYKLWDMGRPVFTERIETAAVQFDQTGNMILFMFNPKFWQSLDKYNLLFVICHEALHVILNHGERTKDAGAKNGPACNAALDIVVNHLLCRNFGFDRNRIINQEKLCWTDTIFKDRVPLPPDTEMFEYYFSLFEKQYGPGGAQGDGQGSGDNTMGGMSNGQGTVDDHSVMNEEDEDGNAPDWGKVIDELSKGLSDEEKETLKQTIEKHFAEGPKNSKAGTGTGGRWMFAGDKVVKKKRKWETVIRRWASKYIKEDSREEEQWARLNRRMQMLPDDMFLPSEQDVDEIDEEKCRIKVFFFLDTSGSCIGLKDRFFNAAKSLPEDKFDIRLFCFDTQVEETTLESGKVYGGGGTAFNIIEDKIQAIIKKEDESYPEASFIITDGYGTPVKPEHPEKWYWFLTAGGSDSYIPKESAKFLLADYE